MSDETKNRDFTRAECILGQIVELAGFLIRMVIIGIGAAGLSHMLTGTVVGWRYLAGIYCALGVYMLGALLELLGGFARKKERPGSSASNSRPI